MPASWEDELRDSAAEATDARERLLNTIIAANKAGVSTRAIAPLVGLSHQRVWQILRGE